MQGHKVGVQVGVLPALPHKPCCQPWALFDARDLCPWTRNLFCQRTCLQATLDMEPGPASGPFSLRSVQHCALPDLLEHKHGLCAVLGRQVETVCEVVLPPQEGIEVIRNEQDLGGERGCEKLWDIPEPGLLWGWTVVGRQESPCVVFPVKVPACPWTKSPRLRKPSQDLHLT